MMGVGWVGGQSHRLGAGGCPCRQNTGIVLPTWAYRQSWMFGVSLSPIAVPTIPLSNLGVWTETADEHGCGGGRSQSFLSRPSVVCAASITVR